MADHDADFEELPGGPPDQSAARAKRPSHSPDSLHIQGQQQHEAEYDLDEEDGSYQGRGLYEEEYMETATARRLSPRNAMHYVPPEPVSPGEESSVASEKDGGAVDGERSMRVSKIILQAAAEAEKEAQAKATALSAAAIAAQARKMRDRSRMKRAQLDTDSLEADYDLEASMRSTGMPTAQVLGMPGEDFEYGEVDRASPTAKDMRGQKPFVHEGKSYNLPMPPAFALLDIKKGRGQRGQWSLVEGTLGVRLCLWASLLFLVLLLSFGLALAIAYAALSPRAPSYGLQEVKLETWTLWKDDSSKQSETAAAGVKEVPTEYIWAQAALLVAAKNPNEHLGIHYEETNFDFTYQGQPLGRGSIPKHYQRPGNETLLTGEWKVNNFAVSHVGHYLEADEHQGQVPLQIKMTVKASVEVFGFISPRYTYSKMYNFSVRPPVSGEA